ncbi:MAG: hypothetical protein ACOY45_15775 [Pseudomonadota bacterium]
MAETLGEAILVLRTDDRGLDAGMKKAETGAQVVGTAFDKASDSARRTSADMAGAGAAAADAGAKFKSASGTVVAASGAQRAGLTQLTQNIGDMSTMYNLGARPAQIFASQIGQVTQSIQLMAGEGSKFAAFLAGPWGIAILIAIQALGPFIGLLWENKAASDAASGSSETWTQRLDRNRHSVEEVTAALREYNAEQAKSRELTIEAALASVNRASALLQEALRLREVLAAELERQNALQPMIGGMTGTTLNPEAERLKGQIDKNNVEITKLRRDLGEAEANFADELAQIDTDAAKRIEYRYKRRRDEARASIKDVEELRKKLAELNREEASELKKARDAARESTRSSNTSARDASVGDMVALLKTLFPGVQITSTTGGGHKKGSDHYAGRAIDFVPAGGMGQYTTAQVEAILEAAGVTIRRNDRGTKQIFGPGRSANKLGDHDDHFHVAWTGSASPEEAAKRAKDAAEKEAREREKEAQRVERFNRALASVEEGTAQLRQQLATTIEEQYQLESDTLEKNIAEERRRVEANVDYSDAEKAALLAALARKESLQREALARRKAEALAAAELEARREAIAIQKEETQDRLAAARTQAQRRAIQLELLDLDLAEKRAQLEAIVARHDATEAEKDRARSAIDRLPADRERGAASIARSTMAPWERFLDSLPRSAAEIDEAFGEAAASGINDFNRGLAQAIANGESFGNVFDQVKRRFIADLIEMELRWAESQLFGLGGGGMGGGLFGSILGLFGLGGGAAKGLTGIGSLGGSIAAAFGGGRAGGGPVSPGKFYAVNERSSAPGLFLPLTPGIIEPPGTGYERPGSAPSVRGGDYYDMRNSYITDDLWARVQQIAAANVRDGIGAYDRVVSERVQDQLARRG